MNFLTQFLFGGTLARNRAEIRALSKDCCRLISEQEQRYQLLESEVIKILHEHRSEVDLRIAKIDEILRNHSHSRSKPPVSAKEQQHD